MNIIYICSGFIIPLVLNYYFTYIIRHINKIIKIIKWVGIPIETTTENSITTLKHIHAKIRYNINTAEHYYNENKFNVRIYFNI